MHHSIRDVVNDRLYCILICDLCKIHYHLQRDQEVWKERPLQDGVLDGAVKNVKHLRPLRRVMMERLLRRFTDGVDVYLGVIRNNAVLSRPDVSLFYTLELIF